MNNLKLLCGAILVGGAMNAQVMVNSVDLNKEVETFELYIMAKPFNTKESLFVNYGQDKFKISNYDLRDQGISDAEGKKFEKGDYMKLLNYLGKQGWEKADERETTNGNQKGKVIIFNKKKN